MAIGNVSYYARQLILRLATNKLTGEHVLGLQHYYADKLYGRQSELTSFKKLVIQARTIATAPVKVSECRFISADATAYADTIKLSNEFKNMEIPFTNLKPNSFILLPRLYSGSQPFTFEVSKPASFSLQQMEKLEITLVQELSRADFNKPYSLEVESVWLEK